MAPERATHSRRLDRWILILSLAIPAALALYTVIVIAVAALFGEPLALSELAAGIVTFLLVAPLAYAGVVTLARRSMRPFDELMASLRAATLEPSLPASAIPVDGWGEIGELGASLRSLLAARESAEQARSGLLDALRRAPVGVIEIEGETTRIRFVNQALIDMLGWPAEAELLGRAATEVDPAASAAVRTTLVGAIARGEIGTTTHVAVVGGQPRRLHLTVIPVREGDRNRSNVVLAVDTSAEAGRDLILEALDRSPVAVMTSLWATGEITGANEAWRTMMGIDPGDPIVGKRIGDHDPVSTGYVKREVEKLAAGGVWTGSTDIHRPDGSVVAADGVIVRLADVGDRVVEFWIDRSGEQQRDLLMAAVASSPLAMLVTRWQQNRVLAANDAWKRLMGIPVERDVAGAHLADFDTISTSDVLTSIAGLAPGGSWSGTTEIHRPDGSSIQAIGIVSRLGDRSDRVVGFWIDQSGVIERDAVFEALRASHLGVVIVDQPTLQVIDANDAWKRLVGIPLASPAADVNVAALDPHNTSRVGEQLEAIGSSGGRSWTGRTTLTRPSGEEVPADGLIVGLGPDHDPFRRTIGIWTDRSGDIERDTLIDAFERSSIGVVHVARDQTILSVNEAWERMSGFGAAEVVGRHAGEIDRAADADAEAARRRARETGKSTQEVQSFLTRKDGRRFPISGWVVELPSGEAFGFWIDASAAEQRDALVEALRASSIGVVYVDAEATMLSVNQAWCDMCLMPAEAVIGKSAYEVDPLAMEIVDAARKQMQERHATTWTGRSLLTRSDGRQVPVEGRLVDLPSGGSVGLWIDRSAEVERDHIMRALETGPVGLIVIDEATDTILSANRAFCDIAGYADPSVVIGRSARELDPDAYRQMANAFEDRKRGLPWHGTISMRTADGGQVLAEGYSVSTRVEGGGPARAVNFWLDRSTEARLERSTEILRMAPIGIAELDVTGRVSYSNEAWTTLGGWSLRAALAGERGSRSLSGLAPARTARVPWSDLVTVSRPPTGSRQALLTVAPLGPASEGRSIAYLSDRSEASQAIAEVEVLRVQFDRIMLAIGASRLVAFYRTSPSPGATYEWVAGAHERITGFAPEALLGRTPYEVDPEYAHEIGQSVDPSRFVPGVPMSGTGRTLHADGHRVPVRFEIVPLAGAGGAITFMIDRSAEVAAEERLRAVLTAEAGLPELRAAVIAMLAAIDLALREPGLPREVRDDLRALRISTERAATLLEGLA